MPFPLTEEQRKIVADRGGELLVSAAAGSGKTRVLVERLLDRVTGEKLDIDQFLVITYTKAAAAELRGRIAQELSERLALSPNDRHLRRQTILVYKTQISTIHAFCAALLRESGHLLDLDPDTRLCDEGEGQILMAHTLEDLLDRQYENLEENSSFAQLADTLGAGRDDSQLVQIVMDIFQRVQSHPDPGHWLMEQRELWNLDDISDVAQTPWGALLLDETRRQGRWCRERLMQALDLAQSDELLQSNYVPSISASLDGVEAMLNAQTWDQVQACLPVPFPAVGRKKKRKLELSPTEENCAAQVTQRVKTIRARCKKQMEKCLEQLEGSSEALLEELTLSRPAMQALMDLVLDFQKAYDREKRRRSVMDFSDLEHFAVKLLLDESGQPTQLAESWAARFAEVLVDEYQDTNRVQNAIFGAISHNGRNLFEVGDVKQSIYRFRLADPTIFLEKYRRFSEGDTAEAEIPRKRILSRNFRSRPQVLLGCNDLFRNIMSKEFGELDYTEDQALVPGAFFPEGEDYALEVDGLDLSFLGTLEGEHEGKDLMEARFAARRIREMLDKPLLITQGEQKRPVRPSDIMILLRSPGSVLHHYLRALGEEGIPWVADGGRDFMSTTEVSVALSILQIVDNPHQDVPLIAALRSPVYGFTGDQLAILRTNAKGDFYSAVVNAAQGGDSSCQNFLSELDALRFGAGDRTCCQLIWHIYENTNLLGIFGAMDHGRERQENLLSFYALAKHLEEAGCRSLFQFLLRLQHMQETGARFASSNGSGQEEGVSILSIHRSKGLEKPVVLVCGLTRRLNRDDLMRPVLFHPVLGIGPKGLDRERMIEYPTIARRAVARQLEQEMMSEELRLLYVAMTRAREKLILTLALTEGVRSLERFGEDISSPVSPMVLENQQSVGAWVLLHVLSRPEAASWREMAGLSEPEVDPQLGPSWDLRWIQGEELSVLNGHGTNSEEMTEETVLPNLYDRLTWQYPQANAVLTPSKLTATQIKGRAVDQEAAEDAPVSIPDFSETWEPYRPDFVTKSKGLTAAQRGTALHLAMQYVDLKGDHSVDQMRQQLDQMEQDGYLTPLQRDAVQPERLTAFFDSWLGQELLSACEVDREFKFSLLVPAETYFPNVEGEEVLLQGVIDAWFDDGTGITVIDFKSDRIISGGEDAAAERHRSQIEAYSQALEQILNRPVKRKVLWFFSTDTAKEL